MTRHVAVPILISLTVEISALGEGVPAPPSGATPASASASAGRTHTYYTAAAEVTWTMSPGALMESLASRTRLSVLHGARRKPGQQAGRHVLRDDGVPGVREQHVSNAQAPPSGVGAPGPPWPADPR